jgi:hypothetical protein
LALNYDFIKPIFGDHVVAFVEINFGRPIDVKIIPRDWRFYTPTLLNECLLKTNLNNVNIQSKNIGIFLKIY